MINTELEDEVRKLKFELMDLRTRLGKVEETLHLLPPGTGWFTEETPDYSSGHEPGDHFKG